MPSKWWNSRREIRQKKARAIDKILRKRYHTDEALFGESWSAFRRRQKSERKKMFKR